MTNVENIVCVTFLNYFTGMHVHNISPAVHSNTASKCIDSVACHQHHLHDQFFHCLSSQRHHQRVPSIRQYTKMFAVACNK